MYAHEMDYTAAQHEREMTRIEIQSHRWFTAFMLMLCLLFMTNAGWIVYEIFFK